MQNILILGGNGFLGTNFVKYLIQTNFIEYYRIIVLSRTRLPSVTHQNIENIKGDINDKDMLISIFQKYHPFKVFHFLSSTVPVKSDLSIVNDINTELVSTINLLEIMGRFNCNYILYISSGGAIYGKECPPNGHKEIDTCNPVSSYGITKWANEQYIKLFQNKGIDYLILRPSNLYGEYHQSNFQGIINISIRKAILKEELDIWGDGNQVKDYLYVQDAVRIIWELVSNGIKNKILNLGSGKHYSINEIVSVIKNSGNELKVNFVNGVISDTPKSILDIAQLLTYINDVGFVKLEEGMINTYLWEKKVKIQIIKEGYGFYN